MASDLADSHTQALESQVGGHAGVMVTEDGSLLIKDALHTELEFYQAIQQDPKLALLRDYTPKFLGMLRLEGELSDLVPGKLGEGGGVGDNKQKDMYPFVSPLISVFTLGFRISTVACAREPFAYVLEAEYFGHQTGNGVVWSCFVSRKGGEDEEGCGRDHFA
jgi:hypothetical protein